MVPIWTQLSLGSDQKVKNHVKLDVLVTVGVNNDGIVKVLHTHLILDEAQFGALPGGGTAAPLRTLRAITDDARQSKQKPSVSLHC